MVQKGKLSSKKGEWGEGDSEGNGEEGKGKRRYVQVAYCFVFAE